MTELDLLSATDLGLSPDEYAFYDQLRRCELDGRHDGSYAKWRALARNSFPGASLSTFRRRIEALTNAGVIKITTTTEVTLGLREEESE